MAIENTFKNAGVKAGTTDTSCYTCPLQTTAIVQSLYLSNSYTSEIQVTVRLFKPDGSLSYAIVANAVIPAGSFIYLDKPMNMMARDVLQVKASRTGACEGVASVMEMK